MPLFERKNRRPTVTRLVFSRTPASDVPHSVSTTNHITKQVVTRSAKYNFTQLVCVLVMLSGLSASSLWARPLPIADVHAAMKVIQARYLSDLLNKPAEFDEATQLAASLNGDGSWADINYENLSSTGYDNARHLKNLRVLALAYRTAAPNNPHRGFYKAAAFESLDYWLKHDYIAKNWWHNDIGNPALLVDIVLLLDTELSPVQRGNALRMASRADLNSVGARPGGDLVQLAQIMAKWAVLTQDSRALTKAASSISSEVHLAVGRGMQYDQSFQHRVDRVIQTTGYGKGFAQSVATFAAHAADTIFELHENKLEMLIDEELDGTRWILAFGKRPSPASMNRDLSRPSGLSEWSASTPAMLMAASDYRHAELQNLVNVRLDKAQPAWSGNRYFWRSAYMAHQRPNYHAAVRMFSSRNANTEGPINAEGLKNHHLADGSCFITRTGQEFEGIAPFMDWQKIPGTTVLQKKMIPRAGKIARMGVTAFEGGVTDGQYGAAAIDFVSPIDPVAARKAWFFFDKQIVALGSAIQSASAMIVPDKSKDDQDTDQEPSQDGASDEDAFHVVSTLNQTRLQGDVIVRYDDKITLLPPGIRKMDNVQWVHHDQMGYVFNKPQTAHVRNLVGTGNWRQINKQPWATSDTVKGDLFALWVDHGRSPAQASYAYTIYPDTQLADMQALADAPAFKILANEPAIQAVMLNDPAVLQVVFYEPGELEFNLKTSQSENASNNKTDDKTSASLRVLVRAKSPCMLMIKQQGQDLVFTASDPTQTLRTLTFEIVSQKPPAHTQRDNPSGATPAARTDVLLNLPPVRQSRQVIFHMPTSTTAGQSVSQQFKWPTYGP